MIRIFQHSAGAHPCDRVAFYGPAHLLDEHDRYTVRVAQVDPETGLVDTSIPHQGIFACSGCGAIVARADVELREMPRARRYVLVQNHRSRFGRRRTDLTLIALDRRQKLVTVGDIASATGVHRDTIRELCVHGEILGAFQAPGKRREWRIPIQHAREAIAKLTARHDSDSAAIRN